MLQLAKRRLLFSVARDKKKTSVHEISALRGKEETSVNRKNKEKTSVRGTEETTVEKNSTRGTEETTGIKTSDVYTQDRNGILIRVNNTVCTATKGKFQSVKGK